MEKREESKSQEETQKDLGIEKLCQLMFPDYEAVKPERVRAKAAMSIPTPSNPTPDSRVLSRGRAISEEEQKEVLQNVAELKAELQAKDLAEISAMIDDALVKQWLVGKCTIDDAAKLIAEKIHPDDDYPWMQDDRKECENEYRKHLKAAVISGHVPFFNPHRRIQFDHERLSEERFPLDGLLAKESLYLGLMDKHQGKGYLPLPPKPVSKAPAPIKPLDSGPPDLSYRFVFKAPDWEKWALLDRTQLWKAACLVAEIEPPQDGSEDLWQEVQLKAFPERFRLLWEIVNSDAHISRSEGQRRSGRMLHTVDIGWFAAWAVGKGLPVPEPMKKRAEHRLLGNQQAIVISEKAGQTIAVEPEANADEKSSSPNAALQAPIRPRGLPKQDVITVFGSIHFDEDGWSRALADPPNWLKQARLQKGTKDKRHPTLWDPVLIAAGLLDLKINIKKLDTLFITHAKLLKEWAEVWEEKIHYLR